MKSKVTIMSYCSLKALILVISYSYVKKESLSESVQQYHFTYICIYKCRTFTHHVHHPLFCMCADRKIPCADFSEQRFWLKELCFPLVVIVLLQTLSLNGLRVCSTCHSQIIVWKLQQLVYS